jgi:hypothetical protein
LALLCAAFAADHQALLPRPQEVRYGAGRLAVRGVARLAYSGQVIDEIDGKTLHD